MLAPLLLTAVSLRALAQSAPAPQTPRSAAPTAPRGDAREAIRIRYLAPGGCPGAAAFLDDVLARTKLARAAAPHELARAFDVKVVAMRGEHFGEISVKRESDSMPVRLSAVGKCDNVLKTLAQFAALSIDPAAALASTQELELPENPYLSWTGPIEPPLPDNPYRHWDDDSLSLPENPYRNHGTAIGPKLPANPYRDLRPAADELPPNPYEGR